MAIIGFPLAKQRPGMSAGAFVLVPRHGSIYAQKWPRKRGKPSSPEQRARLQWMRAMMTEWKLSASQVVETANEAAKISKARPQDWWTRYTSGRMWYFAGPGGITIYSATFEYCVSTALDIACAAPAALAVRASDEWRPLTGGQPGDVLTMGARYPQFGANGMVDESGPNTPASSTVSQALDVISQTPGAIMVRAGTKWVELPPGNPGDVLRINAAGYPEWQAP